MNLKSHIKGYLVELYVWIRYQETKSLRNSIKIKTAKETVDFIIKNRCSVSRYGDGELSMIYNLQDAKDVRKSGFQAFNVEMAKRLDGILKEGYCASDNHYVALPGCMFSTGVGYLRRLAAQSWRGFTLSNIKRTIPMLNNQIEYLETNFTRFYLSHKDKSGCRSFIEHVKQIWAGRDVIIIEGEKTRLGVGNDLFDSAKSLKWDKYGEIVKNTMQITPPILMP
jgi:glycosyltransferase family protein